MSSSSYLRVTGQTTWRWLKKITGNTAPAHPTLFSLLLCSFNLHLNQKRCTSRKLYLISYLKDQHTRQISHMWKWLWPQEPKPALLQTTQLQEHALHIRTEQTLVLPPCQNVSQPHLFFCSTTYTSLQHTMLPKIYCAYYQYHAYLYSIFLCIHICNFPLNHLKILLCTF